MIRYIYIKTSLQTNIQAAIKRNAFMWKSVFIIESLGCYNLVSFFFLQKEKRSPEYYPLLYQSCLDPWKTSHSLLLLYPLAFFVSFSLPFSCISFCLTLSLYRYPFLKNANSICMIADRDSNDYDYIDISCLSLSHTKAGYWTGRSKS